MLGLDLVGMAVVWCEWVGFEDMLYLQKQTETHPLPPS